MTRLLLLDRLNTAPGRAGESPPEGQPLLTSKTQLHSGTSDQDLKNPPQTAKETSQWDALILWSFPKVQFLGSIAKYFNAKNMTVFNWFGSSAPVPWDLSWLLFISADTLARPAWIKCPGLKRCLRFSHLLFCTKCPTAAGKVANA